MGNDFSLSLFKISDTLQMPIDYDGKTVSGECAGEWTSISGLKIPVKLTATIIFFSSQVGVIVHIVGNLYVMISHNIERNGLSAHIIDKRKLEGKKLSEISRRMNLREVVAFLGSSIIKSFSHSGSSWSVLTLPK